MALEISWTPRAEQGYDKIIAYLLDEFTEKEVKNFVQDIFGFLELLSNNPGMLKKSATKNIYRGPINKYTILTYRINPRKKEIQLLNIRESRRKPLK